MREPQPSPTLLLANSRKEDAMAAEREDRDAGKPRGGPEPYPPVRPDDGIEHPDPALGEKRFDPDGKAKRDPAGGKRD